MGGGVSPVSVVRVVIVLLHVSILSKPCDKEPEADGHKDSLPDGLRYLVPHLLVEHVDFL